MSSGAPSRRGPLQGSRPWATGLARPGCSLPPPRRLAPGATAGAQCACQWAVLVSLRAWWVHWRSLHCTALQYVAAGTMGCSGRAVRVHACVRACVCVCVCVCAWACAWAVLCVCVCCLGLEGTSAGLQSTPGTQDWVRGVSASAEGVKGAAP